MSSCLSHICFQSIAGALAAHHFFNTVEIKGLTLNLIFFFPFKSYANKIWTASWSLKHLSDSLWTLKDIKGKKKKRNVNKWNVSAVTVWAWMATGISFQLHTRAVSFYSCHVTWYLEQRVLLIVLNMKNGEEGYHHKPALIHSFSTS